MSRADLVRLSAGGWTHFWWRRAVARGRKAAVEQLNTPLFVSQSEVGNLAALQACVNAHEGAAIDAGALIPVPKRPSWWARLCWRWKGALR